MKELRAIDERADEQQNTEHDSDDQRAGAHAAEFCWWCVNSLDHFCFPAPSVTLGLVPVSLPAGV